MIYIYCLFVKVVPSSKMLHKCTQCDKQYSHLHSLNAHKATHSEKLKTNVSNNLKSENNLKKHMTKQKITQSRKHKSPDRCQCNVCEKTFDSVTDLKIHEDIHNTETMSVTHDPSCKVSCRSTKGYNYKDNLNNILTEGKN